jgi:hypothetical protein
MKNYQVNGTYGSHKTKTTVFVYEYSSGAKYYTCKGSVNVNKTYDDIDNGTDVEDISDFDMFTASKPINTMTQFIKAVES